MFINIHQIISYFADKSSLKSDFFSEKKNPSRENEQANYKLFEGNHMQQWPWKPRD